jgi:hypothetical protein
VLKEINARLRALERVPGIEPGYSAWKAAALPLSYTRIASGSNSSLPDHILPAFAKASARHFPALGWKMVGDVGLEPTKA